MEDKLKAILENFQKSDCIMVSIMQSLMKFFNYEAKSDLYYALGNARILTFPFFTVCSNYFRKCFAYVNDVCYFSGAWASDFITEDAKSFFNKLKEKWFEWADMQQAMPILVGLSEESQQIVDIYILVEYDKESSSFVFINENGKITVDTEVLVEEKYKLFGFTTIDVPYNFMVKSRYYRDTEIAGAGLVQRAGYFLSNSHDMMDYLENILKAVESGNYDAAKSLFKILSNNITKYRMVSDLYRNSYGIFLCDFGYDELGNQYKKLGAGWSEIIYGVWKDNTINFSLVEKTILLEKGLIKKQKGMM